MLNLSMYIANYRIYFKKGNETELYKKIQSFGLKNLKIILIEHFPCNSY